jgi:tRNA A-37 threonylcarbamoyl transferase component Bud32
VRYGRLEDEKPFNGVRRLVEYEDHMLRLLRDAGLPTPEPYGFVEITPEREYLVVMQFFDGATEIGATTVDDAVIDGALRMVARMWDTGVAHRDLKPSNVLVQRGEVRFIDVAFATVRPTPWRQAVDLANMMLTLALSSSPERVYERALRVFAPDDIAEAFAASRSVTIPSQLRARMKADGRDLLGRFRELAPERAPVAIQVWTPRRVVVTLMALAGVAAGAALVAAYVETAGLL